jgi:hypothetical protein
MMCRPAGKGFCICHSISAAQVSSNAAASSRASQRYGNARMRALCLLATEKK